MTETAPQRRYAVREVFHGLRWLVRAGAPWRMLPNDLPPWTAVYHQTRRWLRAGVFEALVHDVRMVLRVAGGRRAQPSATILDSRPLQSSPESGGRAGYAGAKRRRGSKVHMAVDSGIAMYERRIRFRSIWVVFAAVCSTFVVGVRAEEPIKPIPEAIETNTEKLMLGRMLFYDPRLSKNNTTSCHSCHKLGAGGDDGREVFIGIGRRSGAINPPTAVNSDFTFKQFWEGRANTVEDLINTKVQSPTYLGSLWPAVVSKLYQHESYPSRFKALYPDGINRENITNALGEFLKSLHYLEQPPRPVPEGR